jgi:hypothetical protein
MQPAGWQVAGPDERKKLVLHKGCQITTIDRVRAVPLPELEAESRYAIVPHGAVIDLVEQRFKRETGEDAVWAVAANRTGSQFFGICSKRPERGVDSGPAAAVRNSYDKSTRFALALGESVFVCDNLAISGSDLTYSRIHIGQAWKEIEVQVVGQMARILAVFEMARQRQLQMKDAALEADAGFRILGAAIGRSILRPRLAQRVVNDWRRRESRYGDERTAWRLLQHMTEALQREPVAQQMPKLAAAYDLVFHEIV